MENAVDAIKMAFGIFVFSLALTLTVSIIGQARATSETVFHVNDKTEFYEYATNNNIVKSDKRIVGIETVIPTIHRYAKEQFAVTIFDKTGNPIVRYDLWTEGFMANWNDILKNHKKGNDTNYNLIYDRLNQIQAIVNRTISASNSDFDLENMIKKLYSVDSSTNKDITIGAPWIGDYEKILERINCDMSENANSVISINNIKYTSKNLQKYKKNKFLEMFLEVTTSGNTITEDGDSLEMIKGNKKLEIIYILQ